MKIWDGTKLFASFEPGEGKTAGILFLQCFLSGFASAFFFVTASVNFISKVSISRLPLAYILSGAAGFVLMSIYKRRITRAGILPAYRGSLLAYCVVCIALFTAFQYYHGSPALLYVAYLSYVMVMPFSTMFSLGFSTLCLNVFNMAQSKRLLALVSTGDTIAAIGAYLFVPFFTRTISPNNTYLLLMAASFTLLSLLPLRMLYKRHSVQFQFVPAAATEVKTGFLFFTKDKFYLAIAIVSFFSVLAIYLADYSYLLSVRYLSIQMQWKLTNIVAGLFCIIKAGELAASLLSKSVLSNKGMQFSLLLLPASLVFSTAMGLLSHNIFGGFSFFLITFLLLSKWSERVLRKGLTAPAMRVLYQVASPDERIKSQTVIEGPLSQLYTVVSGFLLSGVSSIYASADTLALLKGMTITGLVAYCCWLLGTWKLFKNYKLKIQKYLWKARRKQVLGSAVQEAVATTVSAQHQAQKRDEADLDWQQIIADELHYLNEKENSAIPELTTTYNPALLMVFQDKDKEWTYKTLVKTYLSNDSFFNRLSIIWYMRHMPAAYCIRFVKEIYEGSDLILRQQILTLLHKQGYRPHGDDLYYFTELCYSCAVEVAWMRAALSDIASIENTPLTTRLQQLIDSIKHLLLSLLALTHNAAVIREVETALMQQSSSSENQLFAVELLDATVITELKQYIIPLFEETTYAAMKNKLQQLLPLYNITAPQRLKELTMKDFKIIDPTTRQLALEAYFELTKDETVLHAFTASKLENMAAASARLLTNIQSAHLTMKSDVIQGLNLSIATHPVYLSYFLTTGIRFEKRKIWPGGMPIDRYDTTKHTAYLFTEDGCLTVDTLGLAMLHKLQPAASNQVGLKAIPVAETG